MTSFPIVGSYLAAVQRSHDATKNAWTMRHALDAVYVSAGHATD